MTNDEMIRDILGIIQEHYKDVEWILNILEKLVSAMKEMEARITTLEDMSVKNVKPDGNWMSKLIELSKELEGVW